MFILLECRFGGNGDLVVVWYLLGWIVMGLLSGVRDSEYCLVNFVGFGNKEFYIDELVEEFEV